MAESTSVDVDPKVSFEEFQTPKKERLADFWAEIEAYLIDRKDTLTHTKGWDWMANTVKGGLHAITHAASKKRRGLNNLVADLYARQPWLAVLDARIRRGSAELRDDVIKAYADMSWARAALLTIFLMALIGTADSMVGRPISFRLIYMLPIWVATRLGGGGSGFVATLIVGLFCTIGDTPFEATRHESMSLNFVVRWLSLGGFLMIVLQVEGALKLARQRATKDPLTGLANRFTIETKAEEAIAASTTKPNPIHLALIDCDKFKELNDINGHAFGDHALRMLGKRLEQETQPYGSVARLGGDEFIVLFQGIEVAEARRALNAADKAFGLLMTSLHNEGSITFGIASNGDDGNTYAQLCRVADERMYTTKRAKAKGLVCIEVEEEIELKSAC